MKQDSGFTILESLLAMVAISVVVVAVAHIMITGMRSYVLTADRRDALQKARLAVNLMTNELQTIQNPATGISSISSTSITFTPQGGGSVTYSVSGSNLLRGSNILASNVTAATGFVYYTTGGATTSTPSAVHRIHITVAVDTGTSAHGVVTINSNIYLRNRYYSGFTRL